MAKPGKEGETQTMSADQLPASGESVVAALVPGELIGERFRIGRLIGQGGMGQVFEAHDLELDAPVALKVIRPEIARRPSSIERFKREVHLARQVTDANVCRVFDFFQVRSQSGAWGKDPPPILFLTMELLEGETLAEHLRRSGPLSQRRALPLIRGMANGLDAAHRVGVVHRDFKSSNVLLVDEADTRVVVTDFGLARAGQPAKGAPRPVGGTPAYMAPELAAGKVATAAADIYSLGVVIYEMLTGTLPFPNDPSEAVQWLAAPAPPSPRCYKPGLDPIWEAAIMRCLDRRPERRFSRATEVAEALARRARS